MNLLEGFVCNCFLSIILLKQICLFKPFISLLLFFPFFVRYWFFFKTFIQISFLIFIAKLMHIIPSYFQIIWQKCHNILLTLVHFICYIFILRLIFFRKYLLLRVQKFFFHGHWEVIYFFHGEERYKKYPLTIYCCLIIYWPCS